jgi:hypothetical protein
MLPPLIKNMDKAWVDCFFDRGQLLIRTAEYFASTDDPQRRDDLEGSRAVRIKPASPILTNTNELWSAPNVAITSTDKSFPAPIYFGAGSIANIGEKLPPAFGFSVSENRLVDYGSSAIKILEPKAFLIELCRAMR